jgi:hypothetical protein
VSRTDKKGNAMADDKQLTEEDVRRIVREEIAAWEARTKLKMR